MEKWKEQAPPYNRKFQGRLSVIEQSVYKDSIVVDLGCGEGNFVAGLAPKCKQVFAVDFDEKEIQKAHDKCKQFSNVTLIHSNLETSIDHLPHANMTLCLSVLHHLLVKESYYNYSYMLGARGYLPTLFLLRKIREKTDVLFLEMGMKFEPRVWAQYLPNSYNADWIAEKLLYKAGFKTVSILYPPEIVDSNFQRNLHHKHYKFVSNTPEWFQKMLRFDNRDNRPLFRAS